MMCRGPESQGCGSMVSLYRSLCLGHSRNTARFIVNKQDVWKIRDWWNERIIDGCQLEQLEGFLEGWDYEGPERWKSLIAIDALRMDFELWHGKEMRYFKRYFPMATFETNFVRHYRPFTTDRGVVVRLPRVYIRFGKPPLTVLPS